MSTPLLGNTIIKLGAIDSTNDYARKLLLNNANITDGTVVLADFQENGKGQRTKTWTSERGLNLIISVILYPVNLKVQDQFLMTKVVSLGVQDYLKSIFDANLSDKLSIKWPNDIYVGDNKICGILIENNVRADKVTSCIIGIGLNVNQEDFPGNIPNPTSIKREVKKSFKLERLRHDLCSCIENRYMLLNGVGHHRLNQHYEDSLYGRNQIRKYQIKGESIDAKLIGVRNFGELVLENSAGNTIVCNHDDVRYLS